MASKPKAKDEKPRNSHFHFFFFYKNLKLYFVTFVPLAVEAVETTSYLVRNIVLVITWALHIIIYLIDHNYRW